MSDSRDRAEQAYVNIVIAFLEMGLKQDALRMVMEGSTRYPNNVELAGLLLKLGKKVSRNRGTH